MAVPRPAGRRVVLWLDEIGRSDAAAGRSWAPVGQTPVIKRTGKRFRVNMISAMSNAGCCGSACLGSFTGAVPFDFLRRLLRDCGGRKVRLMLLGIRRTTPSWSASGLGGIPRDRAALSARLQPGAEPVELLNQDVRANAAGRPGPRSAVSFTMSCTGICVNRSATRRS